MNLTAEQLRAIELVTKDRPPLACLTGGPGTGKTSTLKELYVRAGQLGLRVCQAAPSGKAAQRMEEATGRPAMTLHRLMGLRPGSTDWSPIRANLLFVDEASMVDVPLMSCTLRAARAGGVRTVLLVGDADQLPPVGAGQPFADLLAGGVCPTVCLTQVHRQAQESGIVRAAHAIVHGDMPEFVPDFQLVECDELDQIPATVWGVVTENGLGPETSQILAPQRNTSGGVEEINRFVELSRRPLVDSEPLVRGLFRANTKVINTKNDYTLGVFNGELGEVLEAIDGGKKRAKDELVVQIAGETKRYKGGAIRALKPAWALTTHKFQGSEADGIIFVAHTAHTYMLTRRLLYVAITRAAKRVWIVGQREAVAKAARNVRDAKRHTWLARRFARDLAKESVV